MRIFLLCCSIIISTLVSTNLSAQPHTSMDSLIGGNGSNRALWNVMHYDLTIEPDFNLKSLKGMNRITFFDSGTRLMQIDLQEPMMIDSVLHDGNRLPFSRDGNVYTLMYIDTNSLYHYRVQPGVRQIDVYFSGTPTKAANAPWDGGWVWKNDKNGNPWASVACQGDGASIWYPCKELISDKPDSGAILRIIIPQHLNAIGNGRLIETETLPDNKVCYSWQVKNPINNYNIIPYIGKYVAFSDTLMGEKGLLTLQYWVLENNLTKARKHFQQVKSVLHAFEYWFGPYPFYEDGYKLVEAPYLGMEHQSNIAYGNAYMNGYLGSDLSKTGYGLLWDFIIVHETGHEWFGNNVTAADMADLWIHEGFTTYTEVLYTQYLSGKNAADSFMYGTYKRIENDHPIQGPYGIRKEGSVDMYPKGAAIVHMMRSLINNDDIFRSTLRKMNNTFQHKNVSAKELEAFWSYESKQSFSTLFEQYLTTNQIPVLEWRMEKNKLFYRWTKCIPSFNMPVYIQTTNKKTCLLKPTTEWQSMKCNMKTLTISKNFLVTAKKVN